MIKRTSPSAPITLPPNPHDLIRVPVSRLMHALSLSAAFLVLLSGGVQGFPYLTGHDYVYGILSIMKNLFHMDEERNIPTLFSVGILLLSAILLAVIAILKRAQRDATLSKWAILSSLFFYVAVDEGWALHEQLIVPMRQLLGGSHFGVIYFAWVIPAGIGVLLLGLFLLRFLFSLPLTTRTTFLCSAMLYLGGAIGMEMIGGYYAEMHGYENLSYQVVVHMEEGLEMAGLILFIHGLLQYLAEHHSTVQFLIHDS